MSTSEGNHDRLLSTLEHLLRIDAVELEPALNAAAELIGQALDAEKVDAWFRNTETETLEVRGTNVSPMAERERQLSKWAEVRSVSAPMSPTC